MPNYVTAVVPRPTLKQARQDWEPQTPIDIPPGTRLKCDPPEAEPPKPDMVNHPPHYTYAKYEVIDVLEEFFATNAYLWQVGKYIFRAGHKGDEMEDLLKAQFYLNRYIDYLKGEGNEETP